MFRRGIILLKNNITTIKTFSNSSYINNHKPIKSDEFLKQLKDENQNMHRFLKSVYPYFNEKNHITIPSVSFEEAKKTLDKMGKKNEMLECYYGNGFYPCYGVEHLKNNFLTNPNYYSAYIPYQSEISQGRLELLFNYQTMICNLMNMDIANCSLLDEASASAEAMLTLFHHGKKKNVPKVFIDELSYTQNKEVIHTRAKSLGIPTYEVDMNTIFDTDSRLETLPEPDKNDIMYFQYQNKWGEIQNVKDICGEIQDRRMKSIVVMDSLASTIFEPPGSYGADIVVGSTQRFGLPMWNGGPHAAFFATKKDYIRHVPGRIVGKSVDTQNEIGYRLTLQAREQHIKKDKAGSNICTSQALLANYNVLYAMYNGPEQLKNNATYIICMTKAIRSILRENIHHSKFIIDDSESFDTLRIQVVDEDESFRIDKLYKSGNYLFPFYKDTNTFTITIDETKSINDISNLIYDFFNTRIDEDVINRVYEINRYKMDLDKLLDTDKKRVHSLLPQKQFNEYNNEHKITRYITDLQKKDMSLTYSMIPLGSCTMKLNSSDVLSGLLDSVWCNVHPFTPISKQGGYQELINTMKEYLCEITGLDDVSFQSNSGATGEYSALCVFRDYFKMKGENDRTICIIPDSAHGTNFASAILAGYKIKKIKSDSKGSLDLEHLKELVDTYQSQIACMMITFPSTFGFFEESTPEIIQMVKDTGAKIYCDGANMNAFLGLINLKEIGVDACHMNLHKTFTIPHGGGGPGLGPIAVTKELSMFLPNNPNVSLEYTNSYGVIASAPFSSASLLTIPYLYISMCGGEGLRDCSVQALLSANYMKEQLENTYKIPYVNHKNRVSHEFIIDIQDAAPITEKDICKRLMDYGFHGPTMSWPVGSSLMIEPTESEDKDELDRFIASMKQIKNEISFVHNNINILSTSNILINSPHSQEILYKDWDYPYTKEEAYFPLEFIKKRKFNVPISRIDDVYGDRNIIIKDEDN